MVSKNTLRLFLLSLFSGSFLFYSPANAQNTSSLEQENHPKFLTINQTFYISYYQDLRTKGVVKERTNGQDDIATFSELLLYSYLAPTR